jgi:hypothetical protein
MWISGYSSSGESGLKAQAALGEEKAGSLLTRRNMQTHRSAAQVQSDGGPIF